jgi:hypothetical protein
MAVATGVTSRSSKKETKPRASSRRTDRR